MHDDELEIDEAFARSLLRAQFPQWAGLPLRRVDPAGTVNAIFRLGGDLCVRLPRREEWGESVEVPLPVASGRPGPGYPCSWGVHTWVEGHEAGAWLELVLVE